MIRHPKIVERYQMLVDRINPHFAQFEQVKKFILLDQTWEASRTDGAEAELTPSLKLKRRVIQAKYQKAIDALYQG
jgi:long-chain acyl-CoA synthetase